MVRSEAEEGSLAEAADQRARARVGTVVRGKYRIEGLLATGSMASVYAATHRNGSRVALKVLHPDLARDPAMRERFRREGYFANSIAHEGVVRAIDDDDTEDGSAFIVMELLEGETLEQRRLRMGGRLPLTFVLTVADAVLEILAAAHQRDVLHRDLKPDNIYITVGGKVKLLDFGVARWNDGQSWSEMTAAGMVVGTPAFMPPEAALGKRESVDVQSDLWAVGASLFVVLTGETVHAGGDARARLIATARTPARKLQTLAPFVPRGVAAVVDRALAFDKQDRWPDALAMREALRWARRSLDAFALSSGEAELLQRPSSYSDIPPPTARASLHDEPTRRGLDILALGDGARADEDEPTLSRPFTDAERDMLTSAPSVAREAPSSADAAEAAPEGGRPKLPGEGAAPASVEAELTRPATHATRAAAVTAPPPAEVPTPRPAAGVPAEGDAGRRTAVMASAPPRAAHASAKATANGPPLGSFAPPAAGTRPAALHEPTSRASGAPGPVLSTLVTPTAASRVRVVLTVVIGLGVLAAAALVLVRPRAVTPASASFGLAAATAPAPVAAVPEATDSPSPAASGPTPPGDAPARQPPPGVLPAVLAPTMTSATVPAARPLAPPRGTVTAPPPSREGAGSANAATAIGETTATRAVEASAETPASARSAAPVNPAATSDAPRPAGEPPSAEDTKATEPRSPSTTATTAPQPSAPAAAPHPAAPAEAPTLPGAD